MDRVRSLSALGVAIALFLPAAGEGQMVRRSAPPQVMGGEMRVPVVTRESSLPPIRMGSLQPYRRPRTDYDGYRYRGYSYGGGGYGINFRYSYARVQGSYWGRSRVGRSAGSVYTTYWLPIAGKPWSPASTDSLADAAPAESAGSTMRIENAGDSVVRVTWLGTTRPIRHVRVFLADSVQQILRGRLVDRETPSALLEFGELTAMIRYVGLTITFANGLIESTLVPYTPDSARKH